MQRFLSILKVAVLVNILISLVLGVSALVVVHEPFYFIYIGLSLFGNLFFPLLVASALHYLVWTKTGYKASVRGFLLHSFVLFASLQIILMVWAALEVVWDFSLENVAKHYNQEFGKMLWLTAFIALFIPLVYFILNKQSSLKK